MVTVTQKTDKDIQDGRVESSPRIRVNRSAALTLTTAWQRLDFNGNSTLNVNTYPKTNGTDYDVFYDATNKIFKFMTTVDRNYTVSMYLKTTASSLLNTVNLTMATIQLRFVVPNGNEDGTDYYFPFPGEDGLLDLNLVNSVSPWRQEYFSSIFADARKRSNGVGVDVRISNTVLGTIMLASANTLIYGR